MASHFIPKFEFSHIRDSGINFSIQQRKYMKRVLPQGIYWVQPFRLIMWNTVLIRDLYLRTNGDRNDPDHRALVEEFLETLPGSNDAA